jgi:hypothetical protein
VQISKKTLWLANQTTSSKQANQKEWQDAILKFKQSKQLFYAK